MNGKRFALIIVVVCSVVGTIFAAGVAVKGQGSSYVRNAYMRGPKQVTVKTRSGLPLCTLQIPADTEVSIHVVAERATKPDVFVVGDVAIRVLPVAQLQEGAGLLGQMMQSPFELNVRDVEVNMK